MIDDPNDGVLERSENEKTNFTQSKKMIRDEVDVDHGELYRSVRSFKLSLENDKNPMATEQLEESEGISGISSSSHHRISLEGLSDLNEEENEKFESLLHHLAIPEKQQEQMRKQPRDKKLKMIETYKDIGLKNMEKKWGEKESDILRTLLRQKVPDQQLLIQLRSILSTANRLMLTSFIQASGVSVLAKCINGRLSKQSLNDLDKMILFEVISCFKCILNNDIGMNGVLLYPGALDAIVRCLIFEFRPIVSLVLEILSVIAYFSDTSTQQCVESIRSASATAMEIPFASLTMALTTEDLEIKVKIISLLNGLIAGITDTDDRLYLRDEIRRQFLSSRLNQAIEITAADINILQETMTSSTKISQTEIDEIKKTLVSIHGPLALGYLSTDVNITKNTLNSTDSNEITDRNFKRKQQATIVLPSVNRFARRLSSSSTHLPTVPVSPLQGLMEGKCMAAKNANTSSTKWFGNKKFKFRWYALDGEYFKWCATSEKEEVFKGSIDVRNIIDIRDNCSEKTITKNCKFCFEVVTRDRVFALGCETLDEKKSWLIALGVARDIGDFVVDKTRLQALHNSRIEILSLDDLKAFQSNLIKEKDIFDKIYAVDKKHGISKSGLEIDSLEKSLIFLQMESIAAGCDSRLHSVVSELLLVPPHMPQVWDSIIQDIRRYRPVLEDFSYGEGDQEHDEIINGGEETATTTGGSVTTSTTSFVDFLNYKSEMLGAEYKQMSKLALLASASKSAPPSHGHGSDLGPLSPISRINSIAHKTEYSNAEIMAQLLESDVLSKSTTLIQPFINPKFEKFIKMKKILPEAALRQKMALEGFSNDEIDDFLSVKVNPVQVSIEPPISVKTNEPIVIIDPKFEKFVKMKKILPEAAVRHKMALDGISAQEIEDFMSGKVSSNPTPTQVSNTDSASNSSSSLIATNPKFEKFVKMKKLLPEAAVRQKMSLDGISNEEIDDFMSGKVSPPSVVQPIQQSLDPKFEKFVKMKKILPEAAVRQKMSLDGISAQEIEDFMSGKLESSTTASNTGDNVVITQVANVIDPKFIKFGKMKKLLPEAAVRHKMALDGISNQDIDLFFGVTTATVVAINDVKFEKYEKMKKILPEVAVKQRMTQDGLSTQEINDFFNGNASSATAAAAAAVTSVLTVPKVMPSVLPDDNKPEGMKEKPKLVLTKKMKGIFWVKLKPTEIKDTVWTKTEDIPLHAHEVNELEMHFANASTSASSSKASADDVASKRLSIVQKKEVKQSVVDSKKSQNIAIVLGRIRKPPETIASIIIELNSEVLTLDLSESLMGIFPTTDELSTIKEYASVDVLDPPSALYWHLAKIPRIEQRLNCHMLTFRWFTDFDLAAEKVDVIAKAIVEIEESEEMFCTLMSYVLTVGNYLNGGTPRGQAYGVKLEVLKKLTTIKANEAKNGSVMHFIANLVERNAPALIKYSEDWISMWAACAISQKQLEVDLTQLKKQLDQTQMELKKARDVCGNSDADTYIYTPLIQRLEVFLQTSTPKLDIMKRKHETSLDMLEKVMSKFGESMNTSDSDDPGKLFFETMATFAKAFKGAADFNRNKRLDDARKVQRETEQRKRRESLAFEKERKSLPAAAIVSSSSKRRTEEKAKQDDLFKQYNDSKNASSDRIVQLFCNKLLVKKTVQERNK